MRSRKLCLLFCTVVSAMLCVPLAASAAEPSWIETSNRNSAILIEMQGAFHPEFASELGIDRFDTAVLDLNPENAKRYEAAAGRVLELLAAKRKAESDPKVQQDLDILVDAVESSRRTSARFGNPKLVWPYEGQVRQNLDNSERYIAGIAELFRSSTLRDWEAAHARLAAQLRSYSDWVRTAVLPRARKEPMLPRELYADLLKTYGIDIEPEQAISMGAFAFTEIRDEAARLAARIARERNLASADYRDVIRELKRNPVPRDRILALYRDRLKDIEEIVVRERIISLPRRAASIRLASEAESAAIAAPFMNPPRLVGNRGEAGEFVLPLKNPNAKSSDPVDDFTAEAAAWTLTAHEARPGHELQFAAMVEGGVSLARAAFAFNSTNAEGWGLYAESLMIPYFPLEGQLFSLQLRLLRAARAFLDPMVNLGRMTPDEAKAFLMREVALSEPFAQQEADRYAFRMPGQAVSYFYGYTRLRELRLKAELALGPRFEQRRFHDLVIAQGLLPPKLLERSVMQEIERMR